MQDLIFPPLMTGMPIEGRNSDPFDRANAQASLGVDAGLIEPAAMKLIGHPHR